MEPVSVTGLAAAVLTLYDPDGRAVQEWELRDEPLSIDLRTHVVDGPSDGGFRTFVPTPVQTWTITGKAERRIPQSGVVIPSADQLGRTAYRAHCAVAELGLLPAWEQLTAPKQDHWRMVGLIVASEVSSATLRRRAPTPAPVVAVPMGELPIVCGCERWDEGGYYRCIRLDPHPDDYGSDSEGHTWVRAVPVERHADRT